MRLTFLGTGASEGYPAIFCDCANCREARELGGRDLRYRSALLVNDDLLIDFGPDLMAAAQRFNKSLLSITTGLVTHPHSDHFYIGNFEKRGKSFTGDSDVPTLRLFCSQYAADLLAQAHPDLAPLRMQTQVVRAGEHWQEGGYTFTAFRAYHALDHADAALFYSVEDGEHAFLYATDTGPFPDETWQALAGRSFDVIILEETGGNETYAQHMNFKRFIQHAGRMRAEGMLRPGGRLIAHHLAHTDNPVHAKVEAILGPHGGEVAYDGMEINM